MTTTTVADQVERVLKPIQQFVRGWMTGPRRPIGSPSSSACDRVRTCGSSGAPECSATAMPMSPQPGSPSSSPHRVRAAWESLPEGLTHRQVADAYTALCCRVGCDRARQVRSDSAWRDSTSWVGESPMPPTPSIGAVFAGWRAQPQPDDVNARVALTMHVLRELRGGAHIIAVNACGITPLDAVLASPAPPPRSGPVWAEHLGWSGPFADRSVGPRGAGRKRNG